MPNPQLSHADFLLLSYSLFALLIGYAIHALILPGWRRYLQRRRRLRYFQQHPYQQRLAQRMMVSPDKTEDAKIKH
ncbi:hypothetical protein HZU77_004910 [Neisseriaceae bacterium TC5R-5]|nr:hypothetical protein [Neisseriaceae bacterium TC5R-5]